MGTIRIDDDYYTLINIFRVKPGDQPRIYAEVLGATEIIQHFPGFVSANVHLGDDGTTVVNYAQWRSKELFDAMQRHTSVQEHFRACREIAEIDSVFCRARYTHQREAAL
ncbi:antibiotic biosynthesis monooxygenase family protein [Paractinoplanes toevensis]|uniref:Antibiotic biosynthesis monooxygenase n=1 Tax=Paractinoplanes toevensis TaxID=571911 RepID=A0A919TDV3_9ACTN|nr:antibiotic biosynthesis monooxygenase family protein [Actinoplanes toevensis]GIM92605.1 antibiotic biosynthesis monooxygenase [Actinoplanes toevensis]